MFHSSDRKLFDLRVIRFAQVRSWFLPTEIEEDLECRVTPLIEELKAQRLMLIEVAWLAEGKYGSQLPTANVRIERVSANVQKTIFDRRPQ